MVEGIRCKVKGVSSMLEGRRPMVERRLKIANRHIHYLPSLTFSPSQLPTFVFFTTSAFRLPNSFICHLCLFMSGMLKVPDGIQTFIINGIQGIYDPVLKKGVGHRFALIQ